MSSLRSARGARASGGHGSPLGLGAPTLSGRGLGAAALVLALFACELACERQEGPPEPASEAGERRPDSPPAGEAEARVREMNRGVGLMGRFDFEGARDVFADLVRRHPEWVEARLNLAIATLNRQAEGDSSRALEILSGILREDPGHVRAHYCAGLVELYEGRPADALEHFEFVIEREVDDAYAAYFAGQCLSNLREGERAYALYRRALEADPYLRSAYYAAASEARRLGRRAEAEGLLEGFRRLEPNPRSRTVEFRYTRMGPLGEVVAPPGGGESGGGGSPRPEGPLFAPVRVLAEGAPAGARTVTSCDIDADGWIDLYIAGEGDGMVLRGAEGGFRRAEEPSFASTPGVRSALWGDFDNDGLVDVYLCRAGGDRLWRQGSEGEWADVTEAAGVGVGESGSVDGAVFDADHDGDLDIFVVGDGSNELFSNNGDGTFRRLGAERGLTGGDRASRDVVFADLDSDRDLDILVIHEEPPHEVFINELLWSYRAGGEAYEALVRAPAIGAVAADLDAGGYVDLVTVDAGGGVREWRRDGEGRFESRVLRRGSGGAGGAGARVAVFDLEGDGVLDVLVLAEGGAEVVVAGHPPREVIGGDLSIAAPAVAGRGSGVSVVAVTPAGEVVEHPPGPGRYAFAALTLSGMEDEGRSMRSNASGIGVKVEARVGDRWTIMRTGGAVSGAGQSLQPLAIGLRGRERIDFVRMEWPDGVMQTEMELAGGRGHVIRETQRQLSSCPVLFAWNGEAYEFVSDVLGVGGIGYLLAPGEYAAPRPRENLLLPPGLLKPDDLGRYRVVLAEPMEEACYLDMAGLAAVDLPPGWDVVLDERLAVSGPAATGEMVFYRREVVPTRAWSEQLREAEAPTLRREGVKDVTREVRKADRVPVDPGPLDRRFIGMLAGEHMLTLEFSERLEEGEAWLVADGWVEYPYSQTNFAAWQAGGTLEAPTLEARGADGEWRVVMEEFGYPAGMPRRMAVPLSRARGPGLPEGTTALRLRTNQEIYWDRVGVVFAEPCPRARVRELAQAGASLVQVGFPKRLERPWRVPEYDWSDRSAYWDTRFQRGWYTAFGEVGELVGARDGALCVFGAGEGLFLSFEAPEAEPPVGWTRRHVARARGWCKDMDLYTRSGESIEPMPFADEGIDPGAARLHERYNTRFQSGR